MEQLPFSNRSDWSAAIPGARDAPGRTYYWSVQAVDSSLEGSPFAGEVSFAEPSVAAPGRLSLRWQTNDILLRCTGTPGASCGIEFTTNLSTVPFSWTRLGTVIADESGSIQLMDTAANLTQRFYRAVYP